LGPEVAGIRRDIDGDVFRFENSVVWRWERGQQVGGVPQDGAISVVDDVGFCPYGVLPELR